MFVSIHFTMSWVLEPGVKIAATPLSFSFGMSSSGMMPPPKTLMSVAFYLFSRSMTAGESVMCAPDMIDMPIASTSS